MVGTPPPGAGRRLHPRDRVPPPPVRVVRMQAGHRDDAMTASGPTTTSAPPRGVHHVSKTPPRRRRAALGALLAAVLALAGLTAAGVTAAGPATAAPATMRPAANLFEWKWDAIAKECTGTLGPAGYGYVQVSPPAGAHPGLAPVVDLVPARQLQDRRPARHPRRVHEHGRHLPRRRGEGHRRRRSSTTWAGRRRHRHRRHVVHEVQLPRPLLRLRPETSTAADQHQQLQDRGHVQNCELVSLAGPRHRRGLRARTIAATSTTCSRSAWTASASTRPSTSPPPTSPTSSPG